MESHPSTDIQPAGADGLNLAWPKNTLGAGLLFGVLAFQNRFINREELLGAFDEWTADPARGFDQVLLDRRVLTAERHRLISALVSEHVRTHAGDPGPGLASMGPITADPSRSTAPEIRAGLSRLAGPPPGAVDGRGTQTDTEMTASWTTPAGAEAWAGRFRALRPHARGGLGEVFLALDSELNREVALKEIRSDLAGESSYRARFEFEAEVTGGLEHPGIVPVYGLGRTADGRPAYAMRFIRGRSLKTAIARFHAADRLGRRDRRNLAFRELLRRFTDVCDAIAYAHSRGILHRDLKPSNIMLGRYGETLVVDWGLAKAIGRPDLGAEPSAPSADPNPEPPLLPRSGESLEPTLAGSAIGTPGYLSPEQATGEETGIPSDVYGLGATLYHLLTGRPSCEAADRGEALARTVAGEIPRPRRVDPRIPRPLESICRKAMALHPADRYASALALRADIDRWLADEPVSAHHDAIPARAMRWIRRHRPAVVAASAMVPIAIVGLTVHAWRLGQAEARTAEQLAMTRAALLDDLKFSGEQLAALPNSERFREEVARRTFAFYENLLQRFPEAPGIRRDVAQAHRMLGVFARNSGRFDEAVREIDEAIRILAALHTEFPSDFGAAQWLVEAMTNRGELFHVNGQLGPAGQSYARAVERSTDLLAWPIGRPYRNARGAALLDLADVLFSEGDAQAARSKADEAVGLLEAVVREGKGGDQSGHDQWLLAMALCIRGASERRLGDETAAARDLDAAQSAIEAIPAGDPSRNDAEFLLVQVDRRRGEPILGRAPTSAGKLLDRARDRLEAQIRRDGLRSHLLEERVALQAARAGVYLIEHDFEKARDQARQAITWNKALVGSRQPNKGPENPEYLSLLGRAEALSAQIQEALHHPDDAEILRRDAAGHISRAIQLDQARAQDARLLNAIRSSAPPH